MHNRLRVCTQHAPSRILGACWVQSVLVSIFLGRGTCLWQSCHFWHRERRLHHASQLCTTVFLKCTTISVNAPSFLPKCTTKMRNAPSFFWNAPWLAEKCNRPRSFYQNSRTKPKPSKTRCFRGFSLSWCQKSDTLPISRFSREAGCLKWRKIVLKWPQIPYF